MNPILVNFLNEDLKSETIESDFNDHLPTFEAFKPTADVQQIDRNEKTQTVTTILYYYHDFKLSIGKLSQIISLLLNHTIIC